ncbi:hypothetical protein BDN67DRAFT_17 [Paxillus ammoniavirescens]|nr:hypothetical protein BDN67DRAFT_17 [Paxillus ammoniavirescens]
MVLWQERSDLLGYDWLYVVRLARTYECVVFDGCFLPKCLPVPGSCHGTVPSILLSPHSMAQLPAIWVAGSGGSNREFPSYRRTPTHHVFQRKSIHFSISVPSLYAKPNLRNHHQIAPAGQQEFNNNWGQESIDLMVSFAQHSGHSGMNHPALATVITNREALPPQVATASTGHECAWLEEHSRCGERFDTVSELVVHSAVAHDARGTAGRSLTCQWDIGRGPCLAKFRRDHFKRHLESHLGITHLCEHCGKTYSRADSLKNHVNLHHPTHLTAL